MGYLVGCIYNLYMNIFRGKLEDKFILKNRDF